MAAETLPGSAAPSPALPWCGMAELPQNHPTDTQTAAPAHVPHPLSQGSRGRRQTPFAKAMPLHDPDQNQPVLSPMEMGTKPAGTDVPVGTDLPLGNMIKASWMSWAALSWAWLSSSSERSSCWLRKK